TFAAGSYAGNCLAIASALHCSGQVAWQQPVWPQAWHYNGYDPLHDGDPQLRCAKQYTGPGQTWDSSAPNFWLEPADPSHGSYGTFIGRGGYGYPNDPSLAGLGGFHQETNWWYQQPAGQQIQNPRGNVIVQDPTQVVQYRDQIQAIMNAAGP